MTLSWSTGNLELDKAAESLLASLKALAADDSPLSTARRGSTLPPVRGQGRSRPSTAACSFAVQDRQDASPASQPGRSATLDRSCSSALNSDICGGSASGSCGSSARRLPKRPTAKTSTPTEQPSPAEGTRSKGTLRGCDSEVVLSKARDLGSFSRPQSCVEFRTSSGQRWTPVCSPRHSLSPWASLPSQQKQGGPDTPVFDAANLLDDERASSRGWSSRYDNGSSRCGGGSSRGLSRQASIAHVEEHLEESVKETTAFEYSFGKNSENCTAVDRRMTFPPTWGNSARQLPRTDNARGSKIMARPPSGERPELVPEPESVMNRNSCCRDGVDCCSEATAKSERLENDLKAQNERAESLANDLWSKDKRLQELEMHSGELESKVRQLDSTLSAQRASEQQRLLELEAALQFKDEQLQGLQAQLQSSSNTVADKSSRIEQLETELRELCAVAHDAAADHDDADQSPPAPAAKRSSAAQKRASAPAAVVARNPSRKQSLLERGQLKDLLHRSTFENRRMETLHELENQDYVHALARIADSSARPTLHDTLDLSAAEVLGQGNYGFVLLCKKKQTGQNVVLKLQSMRWAAVVVREWNHGLELGSHPQIVSYDELLMHRDSNKKIEDLLTMGFSSGTLTGKRPKNFPEVYLAMVLEYMDRGTVQHLMDKSLLTLDGVAAITRQVASALAFIHLERRTHNDIKPENLLLRSMPRAQGNKLVVKLADMGLAERSTDRTHDNELFAYTVWCMALGKTYSRCPREAAERDEAVAELVACAPSSSTPAQVQAALPKIVGGLWRDQLLCTEIAAMPALQGCEVRIVKKRGEDHHQALEAAGKLELVRRHTQLLQTPLDVILSQTADSPCKGSARRGSEIDRILADSPRVCR